MTGPRLTHGTVCVPDLNEALPLYRDVFEQRVVSDSLVADAEAAAWQAPAIAGARTVVLQPPSGAPVYLRLIEQKLPPHYKPGTHLGWAALEISVKSADAMYARLQERGTPIIAAPKPLPFTDNLYPMQARGPGGEALYLNEVRGPLPGMDLPIAECWVDQLFIVVKGCRSMSESLACYHAWLATATGGEWEMPYQVINLSFGLAADTKHKLATVADGENVLFEMDQYPAQATPAPVAAGGLAPGISVIGVAVEKLPSEVPWLVAPAKRTHAPYFGAMVGVLRGPDGELLELIEAAAQ
jgi:catechol 2,3-dioxygenase-like lactoylglutathione lyase family enzyme